MFRKTMFLAALMLSVTVVLAQTPASAPAQTKIEYPQTKTVDVVDDYFGTKVADPYRWLEDENSPETKAWVEAENKVTFAYLDTIPERQAIKARLTELWNYERFGNPRKEGAHYFFTRNTGLQNQSVWYQTDSLTGEPRLLLDPNTLSADGTVALGGLEWTEDGNLVAYGVQDAGSDWQEWHVMDTRTGSRLPDTIKWVKFSQASWTKDGKGFFYSRYAEPTAETKMTGANYYQKLYYHKLGTPQSEDVLVYERPDNKELGLGGDATEDGAYLAITVWKGTDRKNRFYYKDLRQKDAQVVRLLDDFDAKYQFVNNIGPVFYFLSDLDAPLGRVIAIDVRHPERKNWKTVVPQSKDAIDDVSLLDNNKLVVSYLHDAHSLVSIFNAETGKRLKDIELPGIGTTFGFNGKRADTETFYTFYGFTTPPTVYRYDFTTGKSTIFRQPKVAFDPNNYETKQVFYSSKDGTRVPMFLTYKKGLQLNGQNPTLLFAYGGFDIPVTPTFSVSNLVWMEMGGIYAVANLRGGSEYGEEWHQGGMKMHKQNVFDDFIAAAEWLIANHYTSTPKLAVRGRSNGGLLVGAVETQRPDLFGATLPGVGVMDMLRFQKFTIGWAWVSDYGASTDSAEMFKYIYSYSPYHNIKPGAKYPPTLTVTADHDDRVVPGHTFKFTARMQAAQAGDAPVLVRIETRAGHGGGKPTTKIIEEVTDEWAFLVKNLQMKIHLPTSEHTQSTGGGAAQGPFVGEWKLDPLRSRMPDEMKVQSEGGNKYAFDFGGGAETIVVDGSDQPGGYGGTLLSVKAEAPDTWIVQRKKDGRLLLKATWKLSSDGSTLTDYFRGFESGGSTLSMDYVYQRTGGGSGFAGDWQSIKETMNSPYLLQVTDFQGDGLSFITPWDQRTKSLKFDGKDYPDEGPNAQRGASSSLGRVDERTLVITHKGGGKVTYTEEFALSADLKTLTVTLRVVGSNKPYVLVFERK